MTTLEITGSKSISNRLLIINALYDNGIEIQNLSNSDDTQVLQAALASHSDTIDIHHAGTAMRFLTAYFVVQSHRKVTLTGSDRMKERPIATLVQALQEMGADISYLEKEGFPPLSITGENLKSNSIELDGNISSQFITALMLIGSTLKEGLTIIPKGQWVSKPYIEMTQKIQNQLGIPTTMSGNTIHIPYVASIRSQKYFVESDWSSASYWYEWMAVCGSNSIEIQNYFKKSTQADSICATLFAQYFGIKTTFNTTERKIVLSRTEGFKLPDFIEIDCIQFPDLAQTLCCTAAGLKIPIKLTGLQTLNIKETNRIWALQTELTKLEIQCKSTEESLEILSYPSHQNNKRVEIQTYQDHRMAMAFAPIQCKYSIEIQNPNVVKKSYPDFWKDVEKVSR